MSNAAYADLNRSQFESHLRLVEKDEARDRAVAAETERLAESMAEAFEIAERRGRFRDYRRDRALDMGAAKNPRRVTFFLERPLGQRLARFVRRSGRSPTEVLNAALASFLDDAEFE